MPWQPRVLRSMGWGGMAVLALLLILPTVLMLTLRRVPNLDVLFQSVIFHLVVATAISICALVVAAYTAVAAFRARKSEPVLLAIGCISIGVLLLGHGLVTPGVGDRPPNLWVARFPVLALVGFAVCLIGATQREGALLKRVAGRFPKASVAVVTGVLSLLTLVIVVRPTALFGDRLLPGESLVTHVAVAAAALGLLIAGGVHWRRWRLGGDRLELALVLACWLCVDAMLSFETGHLWRLSWWDYHAYLVAGFFAAAWAVVTTARRTKSVEQTFSGISVTNPLEHIERGYPEALLALTAAVEAKDRYTHGHSQRVQDISTRIGMTIGVDPDALRGLARGALLHDIGKIGVPDQVLNKPGRLDDDEWEWIKSHPTIGWEMVSRAPSLRDALSVIRHHHERWDGTGYPDRLAGRDIPLAARIGALADVWDALTSDRAYRPAWSAERSLDYIVGAREVLFDPLCVDALIDLMGKEGFGPGHSVPNHAALLAAAARCHPVGRHRRPVASALHAK